uniref:Uncharacterized protein n=1 Tax=Zea mays TaxID=4577 RepID=A0A804PUP6_MAIZE
MPARGQTEGERTELSAARKMEQADRGPSRGSSGARRGAWTGATAGAAMEEERAQQLEAELGRSRLQGRKSAGRAARLEEQGRDAAEQQISPGPSRAQRTGTGASRRARHGRSEGAGASSAGGGCAQGGRPRRGTGGEQTPGCAARREMGARSGEPEAVRRPGRKTDGRQA